jgi:hypothetical protein
MSLEMKCVATFQVKSECSFVSDEMTLEVSHPSGKFRALARNILRESFDTPFLISVSIFFDSLSLDDAAEVADQFLSEFLSILTLSTSARLSRYRMLSVVDVTNPDKNASRTVKLFSDTLDHGDPDSIMEHDIGRTVEVLLGSDIDPAVMRALRWYRLGVNAKSQDDQFSYFWFALELVAEFLKSTDRVHDKCSRCHNPLYCENCEEHPTHRPYAKQAIHSAILSANKGISKKILSNLDETRNGLMHGRTMEEIESDLPILSNNIVDILGDIVRCVLLSSFKKDVSMPITLWEPSTYLSYRQQAVVQLEMVVPTSVSGEFDLSFKDVNVSLQSSHPPQSAQASTLWLTEDQHSRLARLGQSSKDGGEMCRRIAQFAQKREGKVLVLVAATDRARIMKAIEQGEEGEWQAIFREALSPAVAD